MEQKNKTLMGKEEIDFEKWINENNWKYEDDNGYYWKNGTPFLRDELYSIYEQ